MNRTPTPGPVAASSGNESKLFGMDKPMKTMNQAQLNDKRIAVLEEGMELCLERLDCFGHDLKVLLVEINIVNEWIREKFGKRPTFYQIGRAHV